MIRCLHCGAETSNGLALCELCRRLAGECCTYLPVYFRNLARWRPGRAGSRPVPSSRVLYDGEGNRGTDRVSRAIDEAGADLVGWAEILADDRPGIRWPLDLADLAEGEQAERLCQIFAEHLTSIATVDWCGAFVRDLSKCENALRSLTEASIPGWYAGGCRTCDSGVYVVPGLTWVTCRNCGATMAARDRLETILVEAGDWIAPPKRLAEALVALLDSEQSVPRLHKRISKWGERERITAWRRRDVDGDEIGAKRYRLGDVMDRLAVEGQTRLSDPKARDAAVVS